MKNPTHLPGARAAASAPAVGPEGEEGSTPPSIPAAASPACPGQEMLWEVADRFPGLALTNATLRTLGPRLDVLLTRGWKRQRLLFLLTTDSESVTPPRAVLAWRIEDLLAAAPPPAHHDDSPRGSRVLHSRPVHRECPGDDGLCGRPLPAGEGLCSACQTADGLARAGAST